MRRYQVFMSADVLETVLKTGGTLKPIQGGIPADARIIGAKLHPRNGTVLFRVESAEYPESPGLVWTIPDAEPDDPAHPKVVELTDILRFKQHRLMVAESGFIPPDPAPAGALAT